MKPNGLTAMVFELGKKKKGGMSSSRDSADEGKETDDMEAGDEMGQELAAEDILAAIEAKDAKKLALALEDFLEMTK